MVENHSAMLATKELRIGLVLYGGVSLAVYMSGIATEVWNSVRASRGAIDDAKKPGGKTVAVYAELLQALARAGGSERLQIVVDTIAGTSAGGINGTMLAKAIVEGGDLRVLNEMWIKQAGLEALKSMPRQPRSCIGRIAVPLVGWFVRGLLRRRKLALDGFQELQRVPWSWARDQAYSMLTSRDGSETPLDGRYFTKMIAKALSDMAVTPGPKLISAHQHFDLFLTRTDFHGWPRQLPVSAQYHPDTLYERTHAHVMSFSNGHPALDDFALTYATRTTAGFPLAFAPVAYKEVAKDFRIAWPDATLPTLSQFSAAHLREHELAGPEFKPEHAWMIDGGILDNKPFLHVVKSIERKPAVRQVCRIVIYVEPNPESQLEGPSDRPPVPHKVLEGLYRLFRHEPIYDDLNRLDERNRKVARIREIVESARIDILRPNAVPGQMWLLGSDDWFWTNDAIPTWQQRPVYAGYVAMSARGAAITFAEAICRELQFPERSRHAYFIRTLLLAWFDRDGGTALPSFDERTGTYKLSEAQLGLLQALDFPIRRRWLRALVTAANREYKADGDHEPVSGPYRAMLDEFKRTLASLSTQIDQMENALCDDSYRTVEDLLRQFGIDKAIAALNHEREREELIETFDSALRSAYSAVSERTRNSWIEVSRAVLAAVNLVSEKSESNAILSAFVDFRLLDQTAYPLMDSADIADLIEVEVMRVSPRDVTLPTDKSNPLMSDKLGAFAGFLSREARENDLLWGRLHGAERLVDLIARSASHNSSQYASFSKLRNRFKVKVIEAVIADEADRPNTSIGGAIRSVQSEIMAGAFDCQIR